MHFYPANHGRGLLLSNQRIQRVTSAPRLANIYRSNYFPAPTHLRTNKNTWSI